jgi:hypothetical protein
LLVVYSQNRIVVPPGPAGQAQRPGEGGRVRNSEITPAVVITPIRLALNSPKDNLPSIPMAMSSAPLSAVRREVGDESEGGDPADRGRLPLGD